MPLAPEMLDLLAAQHTDPTFERPGTTPMSITEARAQHEADARRFTPLERRDKVAEVTDLVVDTATGALSARLYRPTSDAPTATLVWFHGGGWVTGSLDTADIAVCALCARAGVTVLSIDYRLAPEHPWPSGYDDCAAALDWAAGHLTELGGLSTILVGGDSAGGNLAAAVALHRRPGIPLHGQILLYPVIALDEPQQAYASRVDNASGYYVEWDDLTWAIANYTPHPANRSATTASPIRSTRASDAPATIIATVEFDPLRDEGDTYAARLLEAGVETTLLKFDGLVHGCFDMLGSSTTADLAITRIASEVRRMVSAAPVS